MKFNFEKLEQGRIRTGLYASPPGADYGAFQLRGPCGVELRIIASHGSEEGDPVDMPWEHVSVSLPNRTPNWLEMCFVKDLFWDEEEAVMQLHPPKSTYVNNHPYCLHMWRPVSAEIPLPPEIAVGFKEAGEMPIRGRIPVLATAAAIMALTGGKGLR